MKHAVTTHLILLSLFLCPLAQAQGAGGNLAKAQAIFEELLVRTPDDPDIYRYLAEIAQAQGQRRKAEEYYREYAKRRPSDYVGFYQLGEIAWGAGDRGEAKRYFEQAMPLAPTDQGDLAAKLAVARMSALLGDEARSDQLYQVLVEQRGESPEVVGNRIDTLIDTGRVKEALPLARQASAAHPESVPLKRGLARSMQLSRDYRGAGAILSQLMAQRPGDAGLQADYANLLLEQGRWDLAWPLYEDLSTADPENPEHARILDELFRDHRPYLAGGFDMMLNGTDRRYGPALKYFYPIDARWTFEANYILHRDATNVVGYSPDYWTLTNEVDLRVHAKPHRTLDLSLGLANQLVGTSYFPGLDFSAEWVPPKAGRFWVDGSYNLMFDDPVAALYFDGRQDAVGIGYDGFFWERLIPLVDYWSIWYRVNGARTNTGLGNDFGREDVADVGLQVVVLKRPQIRVGYLFHFARLHVVNNYLNIIPLIQSSEQHTIVAGFSHEWHERFATDIGAFVGSDPRRNLSFFDLYGFNIAGRVRATKRLELTGHYEYSSESIQNTIGRYQAFGVGFLYRF